MSKNDEEDRINILLVEKNLRNGYAIENLGSGYSKRIEILENLYPHLFFLRDDNCTFITKEKIKLPKNDREIAEIIGYKSSIPFDEIDLDKIYYSHHIYTENSINIMSVIDQNLSFEKYYRDLSDKMKAYVPEIKYIYEKHIPIDFFIERLAMEIYIPFSDEEEISLWRYLEEFHVGEENIPETPTLFDLNDPFHRGIVFTYLLHNKHENLLSLLPIQSYIDYKC